MDIQRREEQIGPGEVILQVAGCGICRADLGFYFDGIPTRHPLPLTLGHELSGIIVETGPGAESFHGKPVVAPSVVPCGECDACRAGRGLVCSHQVFIGNDIHGGFGTHVRLPAKGLCPVPNLEDPAVNAHRVEITDLAVTGVVATAYQAVRRSRLSRGDMAVFIGVGTVGGFAVQVASALGAVVVAVDVNPERLEKLQQHGATLALRSNDKSPRELKRAIREFAKERGIPSWRHKVFETSGTPEGQTTAYNLLGPGAFLSIVGFTPQSIEICLSNVMALDSTIQGNWGCPPEHYPAVLDLVLSGQIDLQPFVEKRPLHSINESFRDARERRAQNRIILVPETKED
jgi:6-hydroxycyclohex-1-ene-1-carbonyl-CoA dehydrogenase